MLAAERLVRHADGVPPLTSRAGLGAAPRGRVLAVDDHDPFLGALRILVRRTRLLQLVGEAGSGEHALEVAADCEPEFVLMDVHMSGMGGVAAARAFKTRHPSPVVVLISTTPPDELSRQAAASGAEEIVWKSELRPDLLDTIWLRHRPPRDLSGERPRTG